MSSNIDVSVHDDVTLLLKLHHDSEALTTLISKRVYLPASSNSLRFMSEMRCKLTYLLIESIGTNYTPADYEITLKSATENMVISSTKTTKESLGMAKFTAFPNTINNHPNSSGFLNFTAVHVLIKFKNGVKLNKNICLFKKAIVLSGMKRESPDEYYDKGIGLDFRIMISKEVIKASKYILGLHSSVFEVMLGNDWKDSRENLIEVDDVEYDVMLLLVKALHGVPAYLKDINMALKLIIVADKYNVEEMKQQAQDYVKSEISKENVIRILTFAHELNIEDMKQASLSFMTSRAYGKIEELHGWDQLPSDIAVIVLNETRSKLF